MQTQASGRARIGLADGSTLVVRPNSTIIVRDNARADDGKKTNVHVVVDSGQMSCAPSSSRRDHQRRRDAEDQE